MLNREQEREISVWLDSVAATPIPAPSAELMLGRTIRAWLDHPPPCPAAIERRGIRARNRLVAANLRLVPHFYRKWGRIYGHVPTADMLQNGAVALVRAAEKFDPERGYKFSTYSALWLRQTFQRTAAYDRPVKIPDDVCDAIAGRGKTRDPVNPDRLAAAAAVMTLASLDRPAHDGAAATRDCATIGDLVVGDRLDVADIDAALAVEALETALGADDTALLALRAEVGPEAVGDLAAAAGLTTTALAARVSKLRRQGRRLPAVAAVLAA